MPTPLKDPIVETAAGAVRGRWHDRTARFLGVPFAQPPFGPLRFQRPVPPRPWQGVRDAGAYGPTPQRRTLAEVTTIPEPSIPGDDTLSLNVFTPAPTHAATGGRLPVLVWIHGGGFVAGSAASPWYDGGSFARDGVVVVTVAYRLGFEGFGWLPDAPLNRGVLDWLCALEWVRENIAAFGGDPARVTIAGQSAGGGAVLTLLALPAAEGLVHGAISVSGAPADIPLDRAKREAQQVADRLGVPLSAAGLGSVPEDDLIAAQGWGLADRDQPLDELLPAMGMLSGRLPFGPVVDGELVPATVPAALRAGRGARIPLLLGATRDEFSGPLLARADELATMTPGDAVTRMGLTREHAAAFAASLPGASTAEVAGRLVTDRMFRRRVVEIARARADAPTWAYDFAWRSDVSGISEHCLDVPFLFDVLDAPGVTRVAGAAPPQQLADEVHGAYVAFIRDGDPGWAAARSDLAHARVFDTSATDGADGYASARVVAETLP